MVKEQSEFGKFNNNRIMGLPPSYPLFTDLGGRAYNDQFFSSIPLIHISPGNLEARGSITHAARKFANFFSQMLPTPMYDERKFYWEEDIYAYEQYLDVFAKILFTKMMKLDSNQPIKSSNLNKSVIAGTTENNATKLNALLTDIELINQNNSKVVKKEEKTIADDLKTALGQSEKITGTDNLSSKKARDKAKIRRRQLKSIGMSYYMEAGSSVSEGISNSYSKSQAASELDEQSSSRLETIFASNFLWGGKTGAALSGLADRFKGFLSRKQSSEYGAVVDGAKIIFPDYWSDSSYDKNITVSMKFVSPYGDPHSIYHYVYMPFLSLLAMALPRQHGSNSFTAPFYLQMDAPGYFSSDLAVITSLTFRKGGDQNSWTQGGLPTSIDITLSIKDLYPSLMMAGNLGDVGRSGSTLNWLSNLAGVSMEESNLLSHQFEFAYEAFMWTATGDLDVSDWKRSMVRKLNRATGMWRP